MTLNLSIQLWPARQQDLRQALSEIARCGYDSVQPYSTLFADDCAKFKRLMDEFGLSASSVHMELKDLETDLPRWLGMAHLLGATSIIVPHLGPSDRLETADDWKRLGDDLSQMADQVAGDGFRIAWANHDREYRTLPTGERPIDLVLGNANVDFEPVLGWLQITGQDVKAELRRYGDRMRTLRIRDRDAQGWTAIGAGDLGYDALWPAIRELPKLRQVIVDDDLPQNFADFAKISAASLRAMGAGDWTH